jgi:hypothetical protein
MKIFYFTFGQMHHNKDGCAMKDYWVRVIAPNTEKAYQVFEREFLIPEMEKKTAWSNQYTEERFNPEFYPKGEFTLIDYNESVSNNSESPHNTL